MVYPILLNAIPLPDGERPTSNYTLKTNFNLKVLDFVQLGGLGGRVMLVVPWEVLKKREAIRLSYQMS